MTPAATTTTSLSQNSSAGRRKLWCNIWRGWKTIVKGCRKQQRGKQFESTLLQGKYQPTILFGSHPHWGTLRTWAHISVCPHPHLILSPLLQALQHMAGSVCTDPSDLVLVRVLSSQGLVADCVTHYGTMAASGRWCHPTHLEAGGAQADQLYVLRRGGRGCRGRGAKPHEGRARIKQTKNKVQHEQKNKWKSMEAFCITVNIKIWNVIFRITRYFLYSKFVIILYEYSTALFIPGTSCDENLPFAVYVSCGPFTHDKYSVFNLNVLKSEVSMCVSVSSSFEISLSRSPPWMGLHAV